MKKIYSFLFLVSVCCGLSAQQIKETVYLRNGSVIKGQVIDQEPDGIVRIQTGDGSILVYKMSEVERISKDIAQSSQKDGRHRGLDFGVDAGYHITKGGGGQVSAEIDLGKRFNKNFYWGMGTGAFIPTGDGDLSIPITTAFKVFFPLRSSSLTPGAIFRAGYVVNTAGDASVGEGEYATKIEAPNNIMIQIMPSLEIPVSKCVDFNLGIGYTHFIPTKGGDGSGAFSIKTGFGFHKLPVAKPKKPKKPKRPKKPIRDNGVQMTLEGGIFSALVVGYKINPHISVGGGVGVGAFSLESPEVKWIDIRNDGQITNDVVSEGYGSCYKPESWSVNVFLRGVYRMINRRWSPIVGCDVGMRFYDFVNFYDTYDNSEETFEQGLGTLPSVGLFASPSIGMSLRTTRNSYLELKVGGAFAPRISGKRGEAEYHNNRGDFIRSMSHKSVSLSSSFVTFGFTHTFAWGSKQKK